MGVPWHWVCNERRHSGVQRRGLKFPCHICWLSVLVGTPLVLVVGLPAFSPLVSFSIHDYHDSIALDFKGPRIFGTRCGTMTLPSKERLLTLVHERFEERKIVVVSNREPLVHERDRNGHLRILASFIVSSMALQVFSRLVR